MIRPMQPQQLEEDKELGERNRGDAPMTPLGAIRQRPLKLIANRASEPSPETDVCGLCFGTGIEVVVDANGKRAGRKCGCKLEEYIFKQVEEMFDERYRGARLADMLPDPRRHWKQAKAIELVRQFPFDNYFIHGDFGSGKTHLMYAIARHALESRRRVWVGNLQKVLDDFQSEIEASRQGIAHKPILTPEKMRHGRWTLCLDQFEFPKVTEWTAAKLSELIDVAYAARHQIVVVTNSNEQTLRRRWAIPGEHYGGAILRRILEDSRDVWFPAGDEVTDA